MKKNREYIMKIKTVITTDERDISNISTFGNFEYRDGNYYLEYEDVEEDGRGFVKTTIIIEGSNSAIINRSGNNKNKIIVKKDEITSLNYITDHGEIKMEINHVNINSNLNSTGGEVYIKYQLLAQKDIISENEVYIKIKKK